MIRRRTAARDSIGHSATSVGTVDTTVTSLASSQGPTSIPLLTSARGAGTRQPPYRQASHISSQLASKATDRPAITRSPTPSGSDCRNIRDSASTNAAALRWVTATPFGVPVEPDVKITHASSPRPGSSGSRGGPSRPALDDEHDGLVVADDRGHAGLVEDQAGALVGVVDVDRDVRRPGQQDAQDRDVEVGGSAADPHADLVAAADAVGVQLGGELVGGLRELGVGEHAVGGIDGRLVGGLLGGGPEDVDEGARRRCQLASTQGVHPPTLVDAGEQMVTRPSGERLPRVRVAVVGLGMAGSTLACLLADRGRRRRGPRAGGRPASGRRRDLAAAHGPAGAGPAGTAGRAPRAVPRRVPGRHPHLVRAAAGRRVVRRCARLGAGPRRAPRDPVLAAALRGTPTWDPARARRAGDRCPAGGRRPRGRDASW